MCVRFVVALSTASQASDWIGTTAEGTEIWYEADVTSPETARDIEFWGLPPGPGMPFGGIRMTSSDFVLSWDHFTEVPEGFGCREIPPFPSHTVECPVINGLTSPFIIGSFGDDHIRLHDSDVLQIYVFGLEGDDTIEDVSSPGANSAPYVLRGEEGDDVLRGGTENDRLNGGPGADTLIGGGGGNDTAVYAPDNLSFSGTEPLPFCCGMTQPEVHQPSIVADLDGAVGDDGNAEDNDGDTSDGTVRRDTLGSDVESIEGTTGADLLAGNSADNLLSGGRGNDILAGAGGSDTIAGGKGRDVEWGGPGADTLGVSGIDDFGNTSISDMGPDNLVGQDGNDTATYETRTAGVVATKDGIANDGNAEDDDPQVAGSQRDNIASSVETIVGSDDADQLIGSDGKDVLRGMGGNDVLVGGGEVDSLFGDDGQDTIYARDPIPGAWVFWPDLVDCGDNPPGMPDMAQINTQLFSDTVATVPGTTTSTCEQLLP